MSKSFPSLVSPRDEAHRVFGDPQASKKYHEQKIISEMGHKSTQTRDIDCHLATAGGAASRGTILCLLIQSVFESFGVSSASETQKMISIIVIGFGIYTTALSIWNKVSIRQVEAFERARETWEMENFPEGEEAEMVELYQQKGYSLEQAKQAVHILAQNKNAFVDVMMVEELGILPSPNHESIVWSSLMTVAFTILSGFMVSSLRAMFSSRSSEVLSLVWLFVCGVLMSRITIKSPLYCGTLNVAIGAGIIVLFKIMLAVAL